MVFPLLAPLIAAGGTLVSSLMGQSAADRAASQARQTNRQNIAFQKATNQANRKFVEETNTQNFERSVAAQQAINAENWANTLYLNNNSVQMRVEDAKKAGIHPLAALGINPVGPYAGSVAPGFSSVSPQDTAPQSGVPGQPYTGNAVGDAVAKFGTMLQDLQIDSARTELERAKIGMERERLQLLKEATSRTAIDEARTKSLQLGGFKIFTDPATSDAQSFENRYGDLSDIIFGPLIGAHDFDHASRKALGFNIDNPWEAGQAVGKKIRNYFGY